MNPALSVSLIWLLAMLAAAAHLGTAARPAIGLARAVIALLVTAVITSRFSPQPNWVGVLIGLTAIWRLITGSARASAELAGVCAGLAAALQVAGGLPLAIALPLALAALAASASMPAGRDGARAIVLIAAALAAPVVGLAADFAYGWQSAAMLNRAAAPVSAPAAPPWAVGILVLAFAAGAIRRAWK